ncbi:unnamed protein product [Sympodiomycopsis kandeliae]
MKPCTRNLRKRLLASTSSSPGPSSSSSSSQVSSRWAQPSRHQSNYPSSSAGVSTTPSSASTSKQQLSSNGFFTSRRRFTSSSISCSKERSDVNKNPLVKELISCIYATNKVSDPETTWQAYSAIFTSADDPTLPARLPPHLHQHVLRAISPGRQHFIEKRNARSQKDEESRQSTRAFRDTFGKGRDAGPSSSSSSSFFSSRQQGQQSHRLTSHRYQLNDGKHHKGQERSLYIQRVKFILEKLQQASQELSRQGNGNPIATHFPALKDYHFLLEQADVAGDYAMFQLVWEQMVATGVVLSPPPKTQPAPRPEVQTYYLLLSGLLRHMKREHRIVSEEQAARATDPRSRKSRRDWVMDRYNHQRTQVSSLAMALLRDMTTSKGLLPSPRITDLVCRLLRMAGQLPILQNLLRNAYNIDLEALDAEIPQEEGSQSPLRLTVHTLNTILMALGEQRSVSEMVAAFETLRYPLSMPARSIESTMEPEEGSLFKTNFRGLFNNDDQNSSTDSGKQQASEAGSTTLAASTPTGSAIPLNTQTFYTLLTHACLEPAKALVNADMSVPHLLYDEYDLSLSLSRAELQARRDGKYMTLGRHLLTSALEYYEEELRRIGQNLGYTFSVEGERLPRMIEEGGIHDENRKQIPIYKLSGIPSLNLEFRAFYDPPTITPQAKLFRPLINGSSHFTSFGHYSDTMIDIERGEALMQLEYEMLNRAIEDTLIRKDAIRRMISEQSSRLQREDSPPTATNETGYKIDSSTPHYLESLTKLETSLSSQKSYLQRVFNDLEEWQTARVMPRWESMVQRRIERKERKIQRRRKLVMDQEYERELAERIQRQKESEEEEILQQAQQEEQEGNYSRAAYTGQ